MKASAFAPGHISGFFEPVYDNADIYRSGSCGSGITSTLGAKSEIDVKPSTKQYIDVLINNKPSNAPVSKLAIKHLIGDTPLQIQVKTTIDLPMQQGFGMSAAGSLSATYALTKILDIPKENAIKASHCAEIELSTGLGDTIACSFGGIEIRRKAGLPPWGVIEHIPGKYEIVLCVIGEQINTRNILQDKTLMNKITEYGRYCTKKILEKPSVDNLLTLSQLFTKKTNLASTKVLDAIETANKHGMTSMCMLGNSVFSIGDTTNLCKVLSPFGKLFVCTVDQCGARILD